MAAAAQVPCFDVGALFRETPQWQELLCDGLHLSEAGNERLFQGLQRTLRAELPSITPDALPLDFPWHQAFPAGADPVTVLKPCL